MFKKVRMRLIGSALCLLLLASACTAKGTASGPFLDVMFLTSEQVQQRFGKPDTSVEKGNEGQLDYDSLGLSISTWKQAVFYINQTKGRIMDSLSIGDSEAKASTVLGELEPDLEKPGAKVGRIYRDRLAIVVYTEQGKVVRARIEHEGRDS